MPIPGHGYEWSKRIFDALTAVLLLVVLAPFLGLAFLAVRMTMGSPVMFRDTRAGHNGRPFDLLKFRTMRGLRAGETVPESDHLRITRVGRFLRATSIDELPSFINVVKGDMSLVGPRPLPVRYLPRYSSRQARRHEVRPGVTGWAQVNGRNAVGWDAKFEYDVWYVDHRSFGLDLRILGRTFGQLFRGADISHDGHATMPEFGARLAESGGREATPAMGQAERGRGT